MNPNPKLRVQVYKNLHKNLWSVKQGGKVIFHCKSLILRDAKFLVGQAGKERVRREKKKNVHAFITGILSNARACNRAKDRAFSEVTYNPYKDDSFVDRVDREEVTYADYADLSIEDGVLAIWKDSDENLQ
tara:strand:+ start:1492 stop:1884 length:393 start_codon:yes stop_codon:yes gene_type:complete